MRHIARVVKQVRGKRVKKMRCQTVSEEIRKRKGDISKKKKRGFSFSVKIHICQQIKSLGHCMSVHPAGLRSSEKTLCVPETESSRDMLPHQDI